MAYSDLLINTCDILEFTETGAYDTYGQPVKTWAVKSVDGIPYEEIACRHVTGKGREIKVGQEIHIIYDQLFLEDIDVTVQDRARIPATTGDTYQIIDVLFRQDSIGSHHKQAYLERVE